jgi:PAS domain S-box-containing protein
MIEWQFTPLAIPLFVGALLLGIAAALALIRASSLAARYLALINVLVAIYVIAYGLELGQTTVSGILLWAKVEYLGLSTAPAAMLMMALAYTGCQRWLTRANVLLLLAVPALTIAFAWTNEYHEWIWRDLALTPAAWGFIADFDPGPWYWVNVTTIYVTVSGTALLLYRTYTRAPKLHRQQIRVILVSMMIPMASHLVYLSSRVSDLPLIDLDWQAYAFIVTALLISWGMLNRQLFDIGPVARDAIFECMDDSVIVLDGQKRIVDLNPAVETTLGWARAEVVGQALDDLLPEEQWDIFDRFFDDPETRDEITVGNRVFDISVSLLHHQRKPSAGWLIVLRDVTEREGLIKELDAYDHTVAHDLKTPLAVMLGYGSVMEEASDMPPELRAGARAIVRTGRKMRRIIGDLLLMAIVRQQDSVPMEPVNMAAVVDDALQRLANPIEEARADITLPDRWPSARGYAAWIEEMWVNYLNNALKYGGTPPRIELGADEPISGAVRFWVRDSGPGLTREEQSRLFAPFSRLDPTRAKGHGLGLSIVQRIVSKMDGHAGVESEVGQGSTFFFTLPAADAPALPPDGQP